jgi:putative effector of murein hydrolase
MTPFLLWLLPVVVLFVLADWLYRRTGGRAWAHPILLPTIVLILFFAFFPEALEGFEQGTRAFYIFLLAAVAALAVPLYRNLPVLRANKVAIVAAIAGGSITGVGLALGVTLLLGGDSVLLASVASKSVTTPIAISVAGSIGASAPLAAAIVIVTGLVAAIFGPAILHRLGVDDEVAAGLALGTAGHAIGMAEAIRRSEVMGAAAAFAMAANGLVTALLLPVLWRIFG